MESPPNRSKSQNTTLAHYNAEPMRPKLKFWPKQPAIRLGLELLLALLVWIVIKGYMQRDLPSGPVPALDATLLNGQHISLQSHRGHPLLLHFWASWCSICKLEQSSVGSIGKTHKVLSIAMQSGTAAEIRRFMETQGLNFPVIADPNGSISKHFGVNAVPTSFIIDSQGQIVFTKVGYTTEWGLRFRLWLAE